MQSVGIVVLEMVFPSHMSDCRPAYSNAVGRLRGWISLILDHEGRVGQYLVLWEGFPKEDASCMGGGEGHHRSSSEVSPLSCIATCT